MTDENSNEFQSGSSSEDHDENHSSFVLNQTNVPMDVDIVDDDFIKSASTNINGHMSPSVPTNENENENDDKHDTEVIFRPGNPVLNKSFDILPQVKDDETSATDSLSDSNSAPNTNLLDATAELPNQNDEHSEKPCDDLNMVTLADDGNTSMITQSPLPNQFS
ncbi:unnamed protein product, partial [Rotaria socialis]